MSLADFFEFEDSSLISLGKTLKPFPFSPALADKIPAIRASTFILTALLSITLIMLVKFFRKFI